MSLTDYAADALVLLLKLYRAALAAGMSKEEFWAKVHSDQRFADARLAEDLADLDARFPGGE